MSKRRPHLVLPHPQPYEEIDDDTLDLLRAEGEGMNTVEPPPVQVQPAKLRRMTLALSNAAQTVQRTLSQPQSRELIETGAMGVMSGVRFLRRSLRRHPIATIASLAGVAVAGVLLGYGLSRLNRVPGAAKA